MTYEASAEPAESLSPANPAFYSAPNSLPATATRILDEVRGALPHDLAAASISAARLVSLLRDSVEVPTRPTISKGGLASWQERKVRTYIDGNLDSTILVEDLADLVSLSAAHFCRAFKKSFGAKPHASIVQRRVMRAPELMRSTRSPLSQIALDCGFADQTHLSKLFRRLTGQTPNAWRRVYALAA